MKQRENYVAPSSSERASRIRTSILAGSGAHIHGNDFPGVNTGDAKERISAVSEKGSVD